MHSAGPRDDYIQTVTAYQDRRPWFRTRLVLIPGVLLAVAIVAVIVALTLTSAPAPFYVTQLKNDGYTLTGQGLLHGPGIGFAYGQNSTGMGELVVLAKSNQDAITESNTLDESGILAAIPQEHLVIVDSGMSEIITTIRSLGWIS